MLIQAKVQLNIFLKELAIIIIIIIIKFWYKKDYVLNHNKLQII